MDALDQHDRSWGVVLIFFVIVDFTPIWRCPPAAPVLVVQQVPSGDNVHSCPSYNWSEAWHLPQDIFK